MLCRNYNRDVDHISTQRSEEDFFKIFRKELPQDFNNAVNLLVSDTNRYNKFPSIAELRVKIKTIRKENSMLRKNYTPCLACDNSGWVTMILGIDAGKIYEKHFDLPGKLKTLFDKRRDEKLKYSFYRNTYICLCEKGSAINHTYNIKRQTISQKEYNELIELERNSKIIP